MDFNSTPLQMLGPGMGHLGWFSVKTNGSSDPSLAAGNLVGPLRGMVQSITRSASGVYTIVFKPGFKVSGALMWAFDYVPDAIANNLNMVQIGAYDNANRTLVVNFLNALTTKTDPNTASWLNVYAFHSNYDVG